MTAQNTRYILNLGKLSRDEDRLAGILQELILEYQRRAALDERYLLRRLAPRRCGNLVP
ncbi:MAG TPA: hypothetical protein VII93_00120 [Anaerolineales bacterium]